MPGYFSAETSCVSAVPGRIVLSMLATPEEAWHAAYSKTASWSAEFTQRRPDPGSASPWPSLILFFHHSEAIGSSLLGTGHSFARLSDCLFKNSPRAGPEDEV